VGDCRWLVHLYVLLICSCAALVSDLTLSSRRCAVSVGGLIQTLAPSLIWLGIGRIISGFGVGFLSMIVPIFQSEVSGKEERGFFGCLQFSLNVTGYCVSVWADWACSHIPSNASFRIPLLIQCIIGIFLFFGSFLLPESPRHLFATGQPELGRLVLASLRGLREGDEALEEEVREIEDVVKEEEKEGDRSYRALWRRYKGRVMIAMSSQAVRLPVSLLCAALETDASDLDRVLN
jgi:MFS family permease